MTRLPGSTDRVRLLLILLFTLVDVIADMHLPVVPVAGGALHDRRQGFFSRQDTFLMFQYLLLKQLMILFFIQPVLCATKWIMNPWAEITVATNIVLDIFQHLPDSFRIFSCSVHGGAQLTLTFILKAFPVEAWSFLYTVQIFITYLVFFN